MTEITIKATFILVYTSIAYTIEISNKCDIKDLFDEAGDIFTPHIDYNKFYVDFVITGQKEHGMAPAFDLYKLSNTLEDEFGKECKHINFYFRPMQRTTDTFLQMESYK
jgi:hypothetical protein